MDELSTTKQRHKLIWVQAKWKIQWNRKKTPNPEWSHSIMFKGVKSILSTGTLGNRRTAFCFHTWNEMQNALVKDEYSEGFFFFQHGLCYFLSAFPTSSCPPPVLLFRKTQHE